MLKLDIRKRTNLRQGKIYKGFPKFLIVKHLEEICSIVSLLSLGFGSFFIY